MRLIAVLLFSPEIVIITVRWLAGGSGRPGREPAVGVARPTNATMAAISHGSADEGGEQVLDLVAGQRDQPNGGEWRACWVAVATSRNA
jgi:hypothetical protein